MCYILNGPFGRRPQNRTHFGFQLAPSQLHMPLRQTNCHPQPTLGLVAKLLYNLSRRWQGNELNERDTLAQSMLLFSPSPSHAHTCQEHHIEDEIMTSWSHSGCDIISFQQPGRPMSFSAQGKYLTSIREKCSSDFFTFPVDLQS